MAWVVSQFFGSFLTTLKAIMMPGVVQRSGEDDRGFIYVRECYSRQGGASDLESVSSFEYSAE